MLGGDFLHEILRLINGAQVGAHGDLRDVRKAQRTDGGAQLAGGQAGELVDERGSHDGNDPVAPLDGLDELEDLALVHDGAEGAVHKAHAAGHALVVINVGTAVFIGVDGAHAAGGGAGTVDFDDGAVGAGVDAAAALDTFFLINMAAPIEEGDSLLGADLLAGMRQTALAQLADLDDLLRALVAGKLDDVDERRLVVLVRDHALLQIVGGGHAFIDGAQRQAHCQTDALRHDGSLQKDAAAHVAFLAGNDAVGQFFQQIGIILHVVHFVGHAGHLGEHLSPNVGDGGVDSSHTNNSFIQFRKPWG